MHDCTPLCRELKNKCTSAPASKTWHKMLWSWASESHSMCENERKRGKLSSLRSPVWFQVLRSTQLGLLVKCWVSAMNELLWSVETAKELLNSKHHSGASYITLGSPGLSWPKTCHLTALRHPVLLEMLQGTWEVCLSPMDMMAHSTHYSLECQLDMGLKYTQCISNGSGCLWVNNLIKKKNYWSVTIQEI